MKTNSTKTNQYLILCHNKIRPFFENSFLIKYIVGNCMKSKISWIVGLCSIPLILLIVMPQSNIDCTGDAMCIKGKIDNIVDGDTIDVGEKRIRLSLTSTPELDQYGGIEAKEYVEKTCPLGSDVLVDEDDGQIEGSYGRIIGKVYCQGILLNEKILENQHGEISTVFCSQSEFGNEEWATKYGC